ncbi:MAG: hypothetical protein OXR07_07890 [Nitrospira sp.]|nr:hypothetical protein [Nitrospira sp.]
MRSKKIHADPQRLMTLYQRRWQNQIGSMARSWERHWQGKFRKGQDVSLSMELERDLS